MSLWHSHRLVSNGAAGCALVASQEVTEHGMIRSANRIWRLGETASLNYPPAKIRGLEVPKSLSAARRIPSGFKASTRHSIHGFKGTMT
jgi:hypothetical protein